MLSKVKQTAIMLILLLSVIATQSLFFVNADSTESDPGDVNGDSVLNSDDAIYTLRYVMNPSGYPVNQAVDFNNDGKINSDDAIYLLRHVMNPDNYPLHSHQFGEWKTVNEATCEQEGLEERECECGKKETRKISKKQHTIVIDEAEDGLTEGKHCSICGTIIVKQKKIPVLLSYKLLENGTYSITGFSGEELSNLTIPSKYNGKAVTEIADNAFKDCKVISSIKWSDSIIKVGENAFSGCDNLIISVPSKITEDTVLDNKNKLYIFSETVQVKNTATLTIESDVTIIGDGKELSCYGALNINGSEDNFVNIYNLNLKTPNVNWQAGTVCMKYANYNYGTIMATTYGAYSAALKIDYCNIKHMGVNWLLDYMNMWFPEDITITNSTFDDCGKIEINTSESVLIENCVFKSCNEIECGASYKDAIVVKNCTFEEPKKYVFVLSGGKIRSIDNDFGTDNEAEIQNLIYDGNDDFGITETVTFEHE